MGNSQDRTNDDDGAHPMLKAIDGGAAAELAAYRDIVLACPDPLIVLQDDRIHFINPAFTEVFGYTQHDVDEGLRVFTLIQEADRSAIRRRYEGRMAGDSVTRTYLVDLVARGGALVPCETSATTLSFRGRPADLVLIRDITARRDMEEQLHVVVSQYKLLAEQSIMGVVITQGNRVVYANQALSTVLGRPLAQILAGHDDWAAGVVHADDRDRMMALLQRMQRGEIGQVNSVEWRMVTGRGEVKLLETYSKSFMLKGRVALITFVNDISERRRAEERELELVAAAAAAESEHTRALELKRAYEDLNRSHQALKTAQEKLIQSGKYIAIGKLASGVAHEMNNPLSVLLGYVSLLQQQLADLPDEDRRDLAGFAKGLHLIEKAGTRCKTIAIDLLTFARQYETTVEMASVDLAGVIRRSTDLLTDQCRRQGVDLICDVPAGTKVWGNADQLQQVFTNVALNAVQAMSEGGQLTIRARPAGRFILTEIGDTGPGIPERNLGKIFDPFFTTKPVGKGTGLGLSIVYGIVETHGGEVWVDSRPGSGCTFRVKLLVKPRPTRAS